MKNAKAQKISSFRESNSTSVNLLQFQRSGDLAPVSQRALFEKFHQAKKDQTEDFELSSNEAKRFSENCTVLRRINRDYSLRNYLLLEVHATKQWRNQYQSFEDFAKIEAGLSKAQARRSIDSAKVMIEMIEAGMEHTAPQGRQIEEVIKVPQGHRIEAWRHVLKVYESDGRSADTTKAALRDYCRDRKITFGRRKPNGSKNIGLPSIIDNTLASANQDTKKLSNVNSWISRLSNAEKLLFTKLHSKAEDELLDSGNSTAVSLHESVQFLTTIAFEENNKEASDKVEAILNLLSELDTTLTSYLIRAAFNMLHKRYIDELLSATDEREL
ncbi:MAG: hypothetical protein NWT08_12330 [Akkermansiaceae bacterium]|jgi:hypothetical protein|nr:hypothetical protein [Akkermansiaceae bacterium]MDP4646876.1 hypothetical protein [Akkermansiaceae bacterium]MDP4781207.1 hypothetical protein [Akkermansiaceae bacterium]MDP4847917.1 hypothetical protein [Akkermansiaceae bacterium]MDP4899021.1 hypothetical protein [Akkermansiaceae bacterium]